MRILTLTLALTRLRILREHGVLGLFEGLGPRAVQTVLQNFIYFYAYAWLKQRHRRLGHAPTALANTALGMLAGVANLTVTVRARRWLRLRLWLSLRLTLALTRTRTLTLTR